MSTSWNVEIELDARLTPRNAERLADEWMPALADFHAAIGSSRTGRAAIVVTLPAEHLRQACAAAIAVVQTATGREAVSVVAMTTEAFDAIEESGTGPATEAGEIPRLLSVTEAAELLGQSRQSVLQALTEQRLPGTRIGTAWGVLASAVEARVAASSGE